MCDICEAKGHVGANYKATQKTIAEAKRALGRPKVSYSSYMVPTFVSSWGDRHDWTKAPGKRLWGADSLKAYAKGVTS